MAMEPRQYWRTYRQYKADTDIVLTWLAQRSACAKTQALMAVGQNVNTFTWLRLALKIVQSPDSAVPKSILDILAAAIEGREQCAAHYRILALNFPGADCRSNH